MTHETHLQQLRNKFIGEIHFDKLSTSIYATDASVYRIVPLAVAFPKIESDLILLIDFANLHNIGLIPRAAGTSLAGQCVGDGIIVDLSKYFTEILSLDLTTKTVTVQPGVVRDVLNNFLKPFGLFFGPNTSTSNRCMIGGMVGNNSSGTTSIQYGVTRDKVIELQTLLSDGSKVTFSAVSKEEFHNKRKLETLEGHIYATVFNSLNSQEVQDEIKNQFPKASIHRRNTGYAIDALLHSNIFTASETLFNMCQLLTGSEGTLAFTTQITLQLDELPPENAVLIAAHFDSIENCLNSVASVMTHDLFTCEMMDKTILDCTKHNKTQSENRTFIQGDPQAILMCEVRAHNKDQAHKLAQNLLHTISQIGLAYATTTLYDKEIDKAVALRQAGLGLLGNIIGDKKSAACIEDTAVDLKDLASYIKDFTQLMTKYNQDAIYYAHAGAGELHLRPILNLKKGDDVVLFKILTEEVAKLVKSYQGSMSGEHGDGIVRAEFIPYMIGAQNYQILKRIKTAFDPNSIFNPGKIVDALPMDQNLRYVKDRKEPIIETLMDFSKDLGILRAVEKCNGSGDCRKLPEFGGTMCPSYRATRDEKDTTRARANALREFLTNSPKKNRFDHKELKEVFDLCLSCKACASECPSSVDIASIKAEFLYQYQKENGVSFRTKVFAHNNKFNKIGSYWPQLTNLVFKTAWTSTLLKRAAGIAPERSLPLLSTKTLTKHYKALEKKNLKKKCIKKIYLFNDEFTNHLDSTIGYDAIVLLRALNYEVCIIEHEESGRAMLSKGLLEEAKKCANKNVETFKSLITEDTPLIGIEPSAILSFRDEYLKLCDDKKAAFELSKNCFMIDEFIHKEIELGHIKASQFTKASKTIKFHGHCHQKALSQQFSSFQLLNLPENYKVTIIPSGCCGMAGSFGYEQEHYQVSMQVGEQTLFPAIRRAPKDVLIAANGTSCRHQILDGTSRLALHPITILKEALLQNQSR